MGDQLQTDAVVPYGCAAAREAVDWRMAAMERQLAAALEGAASPGALYDGLVEASDALRGFRVSLDAMRALWHEARALGRAEALAGLAAQREGGDPRHGLHVVREAG